MAALPRWRWWIALALAGCGEPSSDATPPARVDADGDGVSAAEGDCDDDEALIGPGRDDALGNAVDEDCDGADGVDRDGDGVASVGSGGLDCDDAEVRVRGAGTADPVDGLDQDCDGQDGVDLDQDGVPGLLSGGSDCDDAARDVFPGARERCNGVDEDCDGSVDDERGLATLPDGATFDSLAAAVAAAPSRAELNVCAGTWDARVRIVRPLSIVGIGGVDQVVLDGGGAGPVFTVEGVELAARGLTIAHGLGAADDDGVTAGGGVLVESGGVLRLTDVVLRDHVADEGAAVHASGVAAVLFTRVTAFGNAAGFGGVIWQSGGDLEVVDSVFHDNVASDDGQVIYAFTSVDEALAGAVTVRIADSSFLGTRGQDVNPPGEASRVAGVSVRAGVVSLTGGELSGFDGTAVVMRGDEALPVLPPSLDVSGTVFDDNHGRTAGAVAMFGPGVCVVDGAWFSANHGRTGALYVGGDPDADTRNVDPVRVTRSQFEGNVGTAGSALLGLDVDLLVQDVEFRGNTAVRTVSDTDGVGAVGAVHLSTTSRRSVRVLNSRLVDNTAMDRGGAVMVVGAVDFVLEDSTLTGNHASSGGGVAVVPLSGDLLGRPSVTLTRVVAVDNTALADGGTLHAAGSDVEVNDLTVAGGSAGQRGGALCVERSGEDAPTAQGSLTAVGLEVVGTSAGADGGAVFASAPSVSLRSVAIEDTTARRGGALAFATYDELNAIAVSIDGLWVDGAVASLTGGAVDAEAVALRVTHATVRGSRASVGGAFASRPRIAEAGSIFGSLVLTDVLAEGNVAAGGGDARGGAVAAAAVPLTLVRFTAVDNRAEGGFGGAVAAYVTRDARGSSTVSVTDAWFTGNLAAEGAGVWLDAATGSLSRVWFRDNEARARGGGLSVVDYQEGPAFRRVLLSDATFERNVATLGGGVFMSNVDLRVVAAVWLDNRARLGAGLGLQAAARTRLSVTDGTLARNLADLRGGGMYLVAASPGLGDLTLSDVSFGLQNDVNTPDDVRIEGVGRAVGLGDVVSLRCTALGPACL